MRIGKRSNSKVCVSSLQLCLIGSYFALLSVSQGTDHSSVSNLDEITQFRDPVLHKIKTSKVRVV